MKKFHVIYKTTCEDTGKWYIGMHSTDKRWHITHPDGRHVVQTQTPPILGRLQIRRLES